MITRHYQLGHLEFSSSDIPSMVDVFNGWLRETQETPAVALNTRAVGYINPHVYNVSYEHISVRQFINRCTLVCIDGIGTALVLRKKTNHTVNRVVALHLFDALTQGLVIPCTAVLIGASREEVQQGASNINAMNTPIRIVATMHGFAEDAEYVKFLKKHSTVQWVLIGAGSPKSESIALQALEQCSRAIVFHMGAGSIKVYAGTKRRAPAWMSRTGLEWAHRLVFEPHTRQRYTLGTLQFLKRINSHHGSKS